MSKDMDLWAITITDPSRSPSVYLAATRDLAIAHFLVLLDAFTEEFPVDQLRVIGHDVRLGLKGLHLVQQLVDGPVCLLTLNKPARIVADDGWSPAFEQAESFSQIAADVQAVLGLPSYREKIEEEGWRIVDPLVDPAVHERIAAELCGMTEDTAPRMDQELFRRLLFAMQEKKYWIAPA